MTQEKSKMSSAKNDMIALECMAEDMADEAEDLSADEGLAELDDMMMMKVRCTDDGGPK